MPESVSNSIKIDIVSLAILDACDYYGLGQIITRVNVPPKHRGRGYGRKLLMTAIDIADRNREKLFLEVSSTGPLNDIELTKWYRRYGFRPWKGIMRRDPQ